VKITRMGRHEGKPVDEARLESDSGVTLDIMSYGVVVRDWRVPVTGGLRPVVLGFDSFEPYPAHSPHFGALTGRVANRIAGASFEMEGQRYELPANEGPNHLHGGPEGLGRQVWDMEPDSAGNQVKFTHVSPDGAMGYPGTVRFEVIYQLTGNRVRLDMHATTDRPTPISLVQHHYFNLSDAETVLDHEVDIAATHFTPVDTTLLPTGAIEPVEGTRYDLRGGRTLRDSRGTPLDYDINLMLDAERDPADPVVRATAPDQSLGLELWTNQPGLQFYDSVWSNVQVPGIGGRRYGKHSGLCFEDQKFPGALAHPDFPSIIETPDTPYHHWCEIEIG